MLKRLKTWALRGIAEGRNKTLSGKRVFLIMVVCMGLIRNVHGQSRFFSNWYFGSKTGLHFSESNKPEVISGELITLEGSTSVSDSAGKLLFYTNGAQVWNSNHELMENGSDLDGNISTTQSSVIIRRPNTQQVFFLITADADLGMKGIRYSEVDMSANNGMGAVTQTKNELLHSSSCEKLLAIPHANRRDIWLLTHDWESNAFRTWLICPDGISKNPVISYSGSVISGLKQSKYGQMKSSNDGKRILTAHYGYSSGGINKVELHDFDNKTGVVSDGFLLSRETGVYGCEFSSDGKIAYASTNGGNIVQYDLSQPDKDKMAASRLLIASLGPFAGAMQLAPDGKIYIARNTSYLSVIHNPDSLGVKCGFVDKGINLEGKNSGFGLPAKPVVTRPFRLPDFSCKLNCLSGSFSFPEYAVKSVCEETNSEILEILWDFGDVASGLKNKSGENNPVHKFSSPGNYLVTLIVHLGCFSDTLKKEIHISERAMSESSGHLLVLEGITTVCAGDLVQMRAGLKNVAHHSYEFLWDQSHSGNTYSFNPIESDLHKLSAVNESGCRTDTFFSVHVLPRPVARFSISRDEITMEETVGLINQSMEAKSFIFIVDNQIYKPDSSGNLQHVFSDPGIWEVTLVAINEAGCSDTSIRKVSVTDMDRLFIPDAFSPNHDGINDVFLPVFHVGEIKDYSFEIFDRWGQSVFLSHQIDHGWDGKNNRPETIDDQYIYKIYFTNERGNIYYKTGNVIVMK